MKTINCPKCNVLIEDDSNFCPYCGKSLKPSGVDVADTKIEAQISATDGKGQATNKKGIASTPNDDEMQDARSTLPSLLFFTFILVLMLVGFLIAFSQNPDPELLHSIGHMFSKY